MDGPLEPDDDLLSVQLWWEFQAPAFPPRTSSPASPFDPDAQDGDSAEEEARDPMLFGVIEDDWDEVLPGIHHGHRKPREEYDRVYMTLSADEHPGSENLLTGAVEEIERELGRAVGS